MTTKMKNRRRKTPKTKLGTYAKTGSYETIDPVKRLAQEMGAQTAKAYWDPDRNNPQFFAKSRGESCAMFQDSGGNFLTHLEEGLGTKIILADRVYAKTSDISGYYVCGRDGVAMIVNDMATTGVRPISVQMHLAVGDDAYLADKRRIKALFTGWRDACIDAGAVWSGGETPVLRDIINPNTAVLAGSAMGYQMFDRPPIDELIGSGDSMIGIGSNGLMANGVTRLRDIGAKQKDKGLALFKAALTPTPIYVRAMMCLAERGIPVHYAVHVTGHGWRKLMRAMPSFTYVVNALPEPDRVFPMLQELGGLSDEYMFGNYNMGIGWVVYTPHNYRQAAMAILAEAGYDSYHLGYVERGPKEVIIVPKGIRFKSDTMKIR